MSTGNQIRNEKKNLGWRDGLASNSHTEARGSEFKSVATKQKATTGLLCIYNPGTVRRKDREIDHWDLLANSPAPG